MMTSEDIKRLRDSTIEALELENKKLKKRAEEAEGEVTIVKGIGMNSPEMKALQARVEQLESSRTLDTMDEVAYRELEGKNKASLREIDRLSEENTNLKTMMKGKDGDK